MKKANLILPLLFVASTAFTQQVEILSNGNVGIGILIPQHKLDVVGNTRVSGDVYVESGVIGTTAITVPLTFKANDMTVGFTGSSTRNNVSFGYRALNNSLAGTWNTAMGREALWFNTTGSFNTAFGSGAMMYNRLGNNNTAFGWHALDFNEEGHNNTAIGYYAGVNTETLSNTTAIGHNARVNSSNHVRIGNSSVTSIGGQVAWSNLSDGRAKTNIRTNVPGLDFINRLQPVTYNMNLDVLDELMKIDRTEQNDKMSPEMLEIERAAREFKQSIVQTGFIAQDVEKTAKALGYDFSGVDVDGMGIYGLRYAEFVVPLVKAVQELIEQNERLLEQLNELHTEMQMLRENENAATRNNAVEQPTFNDFATTGKPAELHQNVPNPFSQATQINYYLPENVTTAYLCFYDLQGKQLRQITLMQRGAGSEIISGSQFAPGIYLYALIADGQEVDVKRMILTE